MKTRTGNFPIGFRRGRGEWQSDLAHLSEWALENGLEVIDLMADDVDSAPLVIDAGLRIGSVDLPAAKELLSADADTRARAVDLAAEQITKSAQFGPMNHFVVMVPEDPSLPRAENFGYMVDSYSRLQPVLESSDARIVIEGWPGPGALCCTPETCRAFFDEIPSVAMGINYDPSHLIRMDIDHVRFLREFAQRVFHVHGKDTRPLVDAYYEYGREQPATFAEKLPYSGYTWRYTIPGHGVARWDDILFELEESGYAGAVSIELEDRNFYGSSEAEQLGILSGAEFLTGC